MSEGLPLREEVPVRETWDLKDLFTSDRSILSNIGTSSTNVFRF